MTSKLVKIPRVGRLVLAALLAAAFGHMPALAEGAAPPVAASAGKALYDAAFKNLDDRMESLGRFKGKVTIVYFWATWCVPCRIETPKLVALYGTYEAKGVEIVGIALDSGDKVRAFVKEKGVTYPIFHGGQEVVELGQTLGNDIGAIPFMIVLDKTGKIVGTFKGDVPDGKIEALLDSLLG